MTKSFDISKYKIHFDGIFEVPEFHDCFYKYLQAEHNHFALEFIDAVEALKKSNKDWYIMSENIISKYLQESSLSQINISGQDRRKILAGFNNLQATSPKAQFVQLFDELQHVMKMELAADSFPRFVRSSMCRAFCEKNKANRKILDLSQYVEFDYKDEDFVEPLITEKDISFIKYLINDSFDWEICETKNDFNSYFLKFNPFPNVKLFKNAAIFKIETIFQFPFEHVICCLAPSNEVTKYDTSALYVKEVDYFSIERLKKMGKEQKGKWHSRSCSIKACDWKYKGAINVRRRLYSVISSSYNPEEEELLVVGKVCNPDKQNITYDGKKHVVKSLDPSENKEYTVYYLSTIGAQLFKKCGENKTLYYEVIVYDPAGWSSLKSGIKSVAVDRAKRFRDSQVKHLGSYGKLFTIKERREHLTKDVVGKTIADIDFDEVKKKYKEKRK